MSTSQAADDRRFAHLPADIRSKIKAGQKMVEHFYGPDGRMRTIDEMEQQRTALDGAKGGDGSGGGAEPPTSPTSPSEEDGGGASRDGGSEVEPIEGDKPAQGGTGTHGVTEVDDRPVTTTGTPGDDGPWEQRYRTLQGMFNTLSREQRDRDAEMDRMRAQLAELSSPSAPKTPANLSQVSDIPPLNDQERASIGDDELLEFTARHAFHKIVPRLQQIEAAIDDLKNGMRPIAERVHHVQTETMFSHMDRRLEGWRDQNNDPKFLSWLNGVDPFSRIQRKLILKQGVDAGDVERVLTVFNTYRAETGTPTQTRSTTTQPTRTDNPPTGTGQRIGTGNGRVPLDTLVHPGRVRSAGTVQQTAPDEPPTVTRAELMQFRNDRARGVYHNDPSGLAEWEAYFDKAIAAGRVI
jgi:hypothetical protein